MTKVKAAHSAPLPLQRLNLTSQNSSAMHPKSCSAALLTFDPHVSDNSSTCQLTLSTGWCGTRVALVFLKRFGSVLDSASDIWSTTPARTSWQLDTDMLSKDLPDIEVKCYNNSERFFIVLCWKEKKGLFKNQSINLILGISSVKLNMFPLCVHFFSSFLQFISR